MHIVWKFVFNGANNIDIKQSFFVTLFIVTLIERIKMILNNMSKFDQMLF